MAARTLLNELKRRYGPVLGRRMYREHLKRFPGAAKLAPLTAGAQRRHDLVWGQMTGGGGRRPSKWRHLTDETKARFTHENFAKFLAKHGVTEGDISTESFGSGALGQIVKEAAPRAAEINEARRAKKWARTPKAARDRGEGIHWAFDEDQHHVSGGFKIPRKESITTYGDFDDVKRKTKIGILGALKPERDDRGGPHQPTYSPEYQKYLAARRRQELLSKYRRMVRAGTRRGSRTKRKHLA